jgi:hypothetical protein
VANRIDKDRIIEILREWVGVDLRPSHLIIGVMIVLGLIINFTVARGWSVWPFVLAFGILTFINEAADRNGQGIPPLVVYAFFIGAVSVWMLFVLILSAINPLIIFLALGAVIYRVVEALLRQRERNRLIAKRRMEGRCIHCGEIFDPQSILCGECGEEPNPEEALLRRVAEIFRTPEDMARARAILMRKGGVASASAKESALLARRQTGKVGPKKTELPKAAKLGPSRNSGKSYKGGR